MSSSASLAPTSPAPAALSALSAPPSAAAAKQAFKQRVRHWAMQLEVPITWLAVCPMRHKWASCSTAGRLHFSSDLLPLDQDLWDLVIVHELLHLCVPNHGRLWKALMRAHLGEWEAAADRLPRRSGRHSRRSRAAAMRSPPARPV
jgi:predicted metal-dependent hydrolase